MVSKLKAFLILFALAISAQSAHAAWPSGSRYAQAAAGPGDIVSGAFAWWGLRCYSRGFTGNVADIWDAGTGSTTETKITCVNGSLVQTVNPIATTCSGGCRVKTLYDQSGNTNCSGAACDATQATNANRPTLTQNCPTSGKFCATFNGSTSVLQTPTISPVTVLPNTWNFVANTTSSSGNPDVLSMQLGGAIQYTFTNSPFPTGGVLFNNNNQSLIISGTDSVFHSTTAVNFLGGAQANMNVDGVEGGADNLGTSVIGQTAHPFTIGAVNFAGGGLTNFLSGKFMEGGTWANLGSGPVTVGGFTVAQRYAMCANQNSYWGLNITGACALPSYVNNFQPFSDYTQVAEVSHRDTNGNSIDARAGAVIQVGSTFYYYGEAHGCGSLPGTAGAPWCGITVYSSTDLSIWTFVGLLFDPNSDSWQTTCASTNNTIKSCYQPQAVFNSANNNYVVWIDVQAADGTSTFAVLTCTTPTGGATPSTPGTGCTQQSNATFPAGTGPLAPALMVDLSGNGFAAFTDQNSSNTVKVVALNSAYTNTTSGAVSTGVTGEGLSMFQNGGTTYVLYGSTPCAYCANATTKIVSASTTLGSYNGATTLNSNSCNAQTGGGVVNVNGTIFFALDQWWDQAGNGTGNKANQGFSNLYWQPLVFAGGLPQAFRCQSPVVPSATLLPSGTVVSPGGTTDQTDYGDGNFVDFCDISNALSRMQQFTPTKTPVVAIALPLAQNNVSCSVGSTCSAPNGTLTVALVTLDGSGNPSAVLASQNVTVSTLKWTPQWTTFTFNQVVTPGTTYGIELTSTGTVGCAGTSFSAGGTNHQAPYAGGVEKANNGGGWSTEAGRSFLFSTY